MQPEPEDAGATVGGTIDVLAGDAEGGEGEGEGDERVPTAAMLLEKKLTAARALAGQDPQAVANIIREWMGTNAH